MPAPQHLPASISATHHPSRVVNKVDLNPPVAIPNLVPQEIHTVYVYNPNQAQVKAQENQLTAVKEVQQFQVQRLFGKKERGVEGGVEGGREGNGRIQGSPEAG